MTTPLNPGIVKTVEWLNANGFVTCDSGDGVTHDFECDLPIPYVHMEVEPGKLVAETDRLRSLLESEHGVEFELQTEEGTAKTIEASYNPIDGLGIISLLNVML